MNSNFWRGKTVLVTGHTGFKGSWLSLWLQSLGAQVVGYSLDPPTSPSLFEVANVQDGMESVKGDIRDSERLTRAFNLFKPEIVFHLAAQSLVRRSYHDPLETFDVNVLGTARLLDAVRQAEQIKAVVVITSDKCYQNTSNSTAHREDDILGGNDPYSSSKACAELVTASYRNSFFNRSSLGYPAIATARAGNVIGGGDWSEDRLLPDIFKAIIDRRPVAIRNPDAIRPWQHVLEPLRGYLMLAERLFDNGPEFSEAWNFGPGAEDTKSVEALVQRVAHLWGEGVEWARDRGHHPEETKVLKLDSTKAEQGLDWTPHWCFDQAIENTVAWYKAYLQRCNLRDFTLSQLQSYQESIRENVTPGSDGPVNRTPAREVAS